MASENGGNAGFVPQLMEKEEQIKPQASPSLNREVM